MPAGQPRKFYKEKVLSDKVEKYFKSRENPKKPLTIMGMCVYLKIHIDTYTEYLNGTYDDVEEGIYFSQVLKMAKNRVAADVMEQAMLGKYNPAVCIFNLKANHDMVETERRELTGKGGSALTPPSFVITGSRDEVESDEKDETDEPDSKSHE